ncbi:hypothetical protein D9M71_151100 [compost metagenome]
MLQVKTLGVRAVQPLVQAGPGQVVGGTGVAQFQDAIGVDQGIDDIVVGQVQLAQVARQPLQHLHRLGGFQVLGAELDVRAVLAVQQFPTIVGVKATAAAGIEQMIGARHPQQEMPGEVDPDHGNFQALGQLQRNQPQRQGLSTSAFQYFVHQCHLRAQGCEVVLGEAKVVHAPQQRLGQFTDWQHRQATADPLLQRLEIGQQRLRLHLAVVLGRNPQCRLEQRGR